MYLWYFNVLLFHLCENMHILRYIIFTSNNYGVFAICTQEQFEFALTAVAQEVQAILHAPPTQQ